MALVKDDEQKDLLKKSSTFSEGFLYLFSLPP